MGSPGSVLKRPPANADWRQETWVRSLGPEDPLEKEMATYSSVPAWRISWTEEARRLVGGEISISNHHCSEMNAGCCYVKDPTWRLAGEAWEAWGLV